MKMDIHQILIFYVINILNLTNFSILLVRNFKQMLLQQDIMLKLVLVLILNILN